MLIDISLVSFLMHALLLHLCCLLRNDLFDEFL